ncbi:MAG TPA: dihydrolipoamide acetyltransferase family protein [Gammaproteobacteria bacterium]|jgi:pyruvate dehydrogenase E2 component (dihydrolipoamide acetyltransferase)|nr:dihydrolipoamide acetyltransferase family protein [Gammaproteobacteria bacterium]
MKIFHLPDLGEGLAEAEIREWYIKVGDTVKVDQPLVSMETAKAVVDVPSPYTGKIVELHGKVNDVIQTGAPLITFAIDGMSTTPQQAAPKEKNTVVGSLEESANKWEEGDVIIGTTKQQTPALKVMPAARVLAQQMQVDLNQVTPSGPQGLITPADVKKFLVTATVKSTPAVIDIAGEALHGVRRTMAQVMAHAHQEVAAVTVIDDVDMSHLAKNTDMTVLLLKAVIAACQAEPALNAWFDGKTLTRKLHNEINIGLAIDTPEGLFVPVIKDAAKRSETQLRETIDRYKQTVRDRSIAASDLQGTTITLSNFGTIAGRYATPVVVPPTVAILACGRSRDLPVIRDGEITLGRILPLSLTFDHRAVTGGEATRFLAAVIQCLSG